MYDATIFLITCQCLFQKKVYFKNQKAPNGNAGQELSVFIWLLYIA
jgi:hypothetical protein